MAFTRQRSGQNLFFDLVSALSGNPVTGQATGISGRVASDDGSQHVLACAIAEVGGGQYVAGLFPADLSGNTLGYLFTASGCVPRSFTIETTGNTSGTLSGQQVVLAPDQPNDVKFKSLEVSGTLVVDDGVSFYAASGDAVSFVASGTNGDGLHCVGRGTGDGIHAQGGTNGGDGIHATATAGLANGHGIQAVGVNNGNGIYGVGGATGDGAMFQATGGAGMHVAGTMVVGSGINANISGNLVGKVLGIGGGVISGIGAWVNASGAAAVALESQVASGTLFPDKTNYGLHASGLDAIQVESGINVRQTQAILLAANAGILSGAGTAKLLFGNASGVLRMSGTVNTSGNRTAVSWNPPV